MKKLSALAFSSLLAFSSSSFGAAIITINFDSGSQLLRDSLGALLTGGTSADGDGAVLQLGYYTGATAANNFLGTWVPLTGEGSLNTGGVIPGSSPAEPFSKTSIGDGDGATNGNFAFSLTFTVGDATTGNSFPGSTSIPLGIKFFNSTSIASSQFFNVVSSDAWLWKTPAAESPNLTVVNMTLDAANLEWQGGAGSALKTTLPVPEPTSTGLAIIGGVAMLLRRRRRA